MRPPRSPAVSGLTTALLITLVLTSCLSLARDADVGSGDTQQVFTARLHSFLEGAAKGDKAAFLRFFAEDVIYTRAVGIVMDRPKILADVAPPKPGDPISSYDAEDILVRQHGDVAVLNFRLVVHTNDNGKQTTTYYRNTGTFQRRNGEWKVIAWQATPITEEADGGNRK